MKQSITHYKERSSDQPPLGGCVLKQNIIVDIVPVRAPAAFRRLCVETDIGNTISSGSSTSRL